MYFNISKINNIGFNILKIHLINRIFVSKYFFHFQSYRNNLILQILTSKTLDDTFIDFTEFNKTLNFKCKSITKVLYNLIIISFI